MKACMVVLAIVLMAASPAWSDTYMVGTTDVGGLDTMFVSVNNPKDLGNSSDQNEVDWANIVLGTTYTTADLVKYGKWLGPGETNQNPSWNWQAVNESDTIWALNLQTSPTYFFIKTGNLQVTDNEHFLFTNNIEKTWAVVDFTAFGEDVDPNKAPGVFSHVGELGSTSVPEPTSLLLLGLGLIGVGAVARKKMQK